MMKKTLKSVLAVSAFAFAMTGCTGDYININGNQYQPGNLDADDYALSSSMNNIAGTVVPADVNCNQFTDCLLGGVLGGYFSDGNDNFRTSFARNNAPNNWYSVFLTDSKIISTLYTNISMVEGYCETSGNVVPLAIANVIKVAAMSRVTDCYGPIPYSQIGFEGIMQTPYDSQQEVYNQFFEDLNTAIEELNANRGEALNPLSDYIYAGDVEKWIKFANSLKLRLAIRIAYADNAKAKQMAEEAVNSANGGVIETNDETAAWRYFETSTNPMRTAIMYNNQDSRPAADIICYMNGYNDPRRAQYFTESNWKDSDGNFIKDSQGNPVQYVGVRRGWDTYNALAWGIKFSGINLDAHAPLYWLNAAEVAFLRAEAVAVFGFNMGGTAEQFYNDGIRLSFEQYGVSGAEDYLSDSTSVPANYYDPSGVNAWSGSLPQVTIKWDESATTEEKQERIMIQKWIANYTIGNEAWADIRRTGYPKLIPVAYDGSNGVVDINVGPQRMAYPQDEYSNNTANVQKAVSDYLKGPDNMATRVWWACKPGL
jgi:hypothetical protein